MGSKQRLNEKVKTLATKSNLSSLHKADISVLALGDELKVKTILTDDLQLREKSKARNFKPVGTIGIIFKSYTDRLIIRKDLERLIGELFGKSGLFLEKGFRNYIMGGSKISKNVRRSYAL